MNNISSVILGGVLAIVGTSLVKWLEYSFERRSLRAAIKAEINGLIDMITRRGHGDMFRAAIQSWRAEEEFDLYVFTLDANFTPVYDANIGKVGMLGADVAGDVVKFYDIMIGVKAELRAHINGQTHRMSHAVRADRLETLLESWAEAIELAETLTKRL
jgi:hypothetical protein